MPSLDRRISSSRRALEERRGSRPLPELEEAVRHMDAIRPFTEGIVGEEISFVLRMAEADPAILAEAQDAGAAGLALTLGALAIWGPALSPRETAWMRDYALHQERAGIGVLGDVTNAVTLLAAGFLVAKRELRTVLTAAAAMLGLFALFALLPRAGLYPARFAPLLLVAVTPLWARAAAARIPLLAPIALLIALPGHLRWYQRAPPMATSGDVAAIQCVRRETPPSAVIDGAYGDATQWIPALAGRAVTRPHEHVSLFDEIEAALSRLPKAAFHFTGERLIYGDPAPPAEGMPLCGGKLLRVQSGNNSR